MKIENFFNKILQGDIWKISREMYYDTRHFSNALLLPKGKRYYTLEKDINRMNSDDAISRMKEHFAGIEKQLSQKSVLKVGFCVYSSSEWQCEKIYRYMDVDSRFAPTIILCGLNTGNKELTERTYKETCSFFEEKGTYALDYYGCKKHNGKEKDIDQYDIIFYFQPSSNYLPESVNFAYRLQNQLMAFVLYGYKQISEKDIHVKRNFMGADLLQMFWVYFCVNRSEYKTREVTKLKGYNAVISGFPKIDDLLDSTFEIREALWKENPLTKKRIIWAPHFNMEENMNGTFHENFRWFYEYACAHMEISWIVRPHPRMLKGVLQKGIFKSAEEYYEYLERWNTLPNAAVLPMGEYYDFFASSDAMITDSMSFVPEYLYTKKPLLLLLPESPRKVNEDAERMRKEACYHARGNDYEAIRRFIEEDIDTDPLQNPRNNVYMDILDTRSRLGMSASRYIYERIGNAIWK